MTCVCRYADPDLFKNDYYWVWIGEILMGHVVVLASFYFGFVMNRKKKNNNNNNKNMKTGNVYDFSF